MVTRNRHNEPNSDGWWDDLPPSVKKRVPRPEPSPLPSLDSRAAEYQEPHSPPRQSTVASDLSRLAVLFFAVAIGNILFLLIALSFLSGNGLFAR